MQKSSNIVIAVMVTVVALGAVAFGLLRPDGQVADEVLDRPVTTAPAQAPTQSDPATTKATTIPTTVPAVPPTTVPPTTVPMPSVVASGSFVSLDYDTAGAVSVVNDQGVNTLVMTDLATDDGPELFVYLSPLTKDAGNDYSTGALKLGPLKSTTGNQSYAIPAGTDLSAYRSVLIWCERFSAGFGIADLMAS